MNAARTGQQSSTFAPLRMALFRRLWIAGLAANLGTFVQSVAAAWLMVEMSQSAEMVALVQSALSLPIMLFALVAGALADMVARRTIMLIAHAVMLVAAVGLCAAAATGPVHPWVLLGLCFAVGSGRALFQPAWQASVREQVELKDIASAVSLNSISYNAARGLGPALGGVVVAIGGALSAFLVTAASYLGFICALFSWKPTPAKHLLPPERLGRALNSGVRFVLNAPWVKVVMARSTVFGLGASALWALLPLIARDVLTGGVTVYGLLVGAVGTGAVLGALVSAQTTRLLGRERAIRVAACVFGLVLIILPFNPFLVPTLAGLVLAGGAWTLSMTTFNVTMQLAAPKWVAGRALAAYQTAAFGGVAFGSWIWGLVAVSQGIGSACVAAGLVLAATSAIGFRWPIPASEDTNADWIDDLPDPSPLLPVNARTGPILVQVEYRIDANDAAAFVDIMDIVREGRARNGCHAWTLSRDLADPEIWVERFQSPTWTDYLRHRARTTAADRRARRTAMAFHRGTKPIVVRRFLQRQETGATEAKR
jgi:MFS family permease/quinol monooxygenase YgiN